MELVVDSAASCLGRLIMCTERRSKPSTRHDHWLGAAQVLFSEVIFSRKVATPSLCS
jgi:hypothetical protein